MVLESSDLCSLESSDLQIFRPTFSGLTLLLLRLAVPVNEWHCSFLESGVTKAFSLRRPNRISAHEGRYTECPTQSSGWIEMMAPLTTASQRTGKGDVSATRNRHRLCRHPDP